MKGLKVGEWYDWDDIKEAIGKFEYLSTLGTGYNENFEFHPQTDLRRKKFAQLIWIKNRKTGKLEHIDDLKDRCKNK